MTDLHALIRRSIIDRGLTSSAARWEVYRQARTAVIRELWSYDPPLAEDEIEARIGQFDLAIGELEDDLAEAFAEAARPPPRALLPPPRRGPAAVFEGYDDETDYVPAYVAPARQPSGPRNAGSRRPPGGARDSRGDRLDPLALRSAAIEEALRTGSDGAVPEEDYTQPQPEAFAARTSSEEPDDDHRTTGWSWDHDEADPTDDQSADTEDWRESGASEYVADDTGEDEPRRPARRSWTAFLGNLDIRTRVRILIGAIAGLGVVLAVLAGFIVSSLLSGSDSPPQVARPAIVPATGAGDEALVPPTLPADTVQTFTVFDGTDPTVFDSSPGNPVRFDKSGAFARITSSAGDPGVRVVIGPGLSNRLSGRAVRVTLVARAARENGATGLRFAYENGLAISPWQTADLGNAFQSFNLVWRVPAMRADPNTDQLLIEPGIPGDGTAADIHSIKLDLLSSVQ